MIGWTHVKVALPPFGKNVRCLLLNGGIAYGWVEKLDLGYWNDPKGEDSAAGGKPHRAPRDVRPRGAAGKAGSRERHIWLGPNSKGQVVALQAIGWQRAGDKVSLPMSVVPSEEVERRLLAFCRTVRVLPGDDLRAKSTWPAAFVDIARRMDAEFRWVEREEEPRRYIPTPRDLDDVLLAGSWFARLKPPVDDQSEHLNSLRRNAWRFSLEQKLIWWASFEPRPSFRTMALWHGKLSHTTIRNRYKQALGRAFDFANEHAQSQGG